MSKLERLFTSMNLNIEENATVTKATDGIKSIIKCNNKPIVSDISRMEQFLVRNRGQSIVFNTHSKTKDCSYLFLEQHVHEVLSSKINFIVSKLLELSQSPELYNQVKSQKLKQLLLKFVNGDLVDFDNTREDSLSSKWKKLNDKVSEKSLQDGLIRLHYKIDDVCIEDEAMIEYYKSVHKITDDKACVFVYFTSSASVEFPLYSLFKEAKNQLLGVHLAKTEVEVLKAIYQYIFKDIEKKNAYSSLDTSLLKERLQTRNENVYIVKSKADMDVPSILLIKTFNSLATHIDGILDEMVDIDESLGTEKFNLNLTKEEINGLKSYNEFTANYNSGSMHDFKSEIKSNPRIKFEEFNKQLNEVSQKTDKKVTIGQQKNQAYKNRSASFLPTQSLSSTSLFGMVRSDNSHIILDPKNERFESLIPSKERKRHTYLLGGSGSGKTSLLESFLYADCKKTEQSTIIFDLMGKATKSVMKFVSDPNRVVIIDPYLHSSITPIINPFELKSKDELSIENRTKAIINAFDIALNLENGWSTNMKAVLAPCISTLLRKGGADIYELQRFMNDKFNSDLVKLGIQSPIRGHKSFFLQEFYSESYEVTKNAISAKLQVFLNDPSFASLVTGASTINLEKEVNTKGKIIIFKLPSKQKLFARLMMEMIQDIMRERINLSEDEIVPTHIYLDEFQNYLTPTIEEILSESRNYKFYVTFAHQSFVHLSRKMQGIVLSNSNIKIVGQCSYDDGKKMSKEMKANFETIEALEQGEFIFKVGSNTAVKWKNTDRFINDKTPYHTKQRTKHMKYQFKHNYTYKEGAPLASENDSNVTERQPKHEEF
ncbi:MAG: type IV secretion system DNA-binding domain-containing protein [Gammaproteobacteria bacterium]|nr:type IV secretion system DNA-binding domain-containing protein [Gammaproteobacteria bacterium]